MTVVAEATVVDWWRTLIAHRPIEVRAGEPPQCPICHQRKCWEWADAFATLVAADEWHKGPPPEVDRPQTTAGGARRAS